MAPRLRDIHPVSALRPEEDVFLFRDTGMLAVPVAAPGYLGWLQATDPTPAYRTYRRHLQALLQDRPGRRPVLKSPFHLGRLGALLAEVPRGGGGVDPPRSRRGVGELVQPGRRARQRRRRPGGPGCAGPAVAGLLGGRAGSGADGQGRRRSGPLPRRGLPGAGGSAAITTAAAAAPIGTVWPTLGWTRPSSTGASRATATGWRRAPRHDPAARHQTDGQQGIRDGYPLSVGRILAAAAARLSMPIIPGRLGRSLPASS
jgi:hypothetical protein